MEYHIDTQVCVIGAGHAGVEAALACSRLGLKALKPHWPAAGSDLRL